MVKHGIVQNRKAVTAAVVAIVILLLMCAVAMPIGIYITSTAQSSMLSTLAVVGTRYVWIEWTSELEDGYIEKNDAVYGTARNATTGTVTADSTVIKVGQDYIEVNGGYYVDRGYLHFDVDEAALQEAIAIKMGVGDAEDITLIDVVSAKLQLTLEEPMNTTDFNLVLQNEATWTYPHDTLAEGDYLHSQYSNSHGTYNTAGLPANDAAFNITVNAAGCRWINDSIASGNMVKWAVRSSNDIGNTAPTLPEYISVYSRDDLEEDYYPTLHMRIAYSISGDYVNQEALDIVEGATQNIYNAFYIAAIVPFIAAAALVLGIVITAFAIRSKLER